MANRYWVGGTAAWDGTAGTKWALTSGGAGGQAVPTSADDVFFDASSGANTVTISTGNTGAKSITCTGFTGTLAGTAALSVAGNITLVAGMTLTYSGLLTITATSTLTSAGKTMGDITVSAVGGTVTLGGALTLSSSGTFTVTDGTFTTSASNYALSAVNMVFSGTGSKTVTLNASTITMTGGSTFASAAVKYSGSNLTFNANTSTINLSNASANIDGGAGLTFNNVSFTSTSGTTTLRRGIYGANTFNQLSVTSPSAAGVAHILVGANQTITTFVCAGSTTYQRISIETDTPGTARTLTVGTYTTIANVDFREITAAGTSSPWSSGTSIGNCGNNSNITFSSAKTVYFVGTTSANFGGTQWATSSGGATSAANFPLAQDTANIDNSSLNASATLTVNASYNIGVLTFSTRTNAITFATGSSFFSSFGDLTLSSSVTLTGTGILEFAKRGGTQTIISAGVSFTQLPYFNSYGGTIVFSDAFTSNAAGGAQLYNGTLNLNGKTITLVAININDGVAKNITFNAGTLTLTGSGGTVYYTQYPTGYTTTAGSGTGYISFTSASAKTMVNDGSVTINAVINQGGAGALSLPGTFTALDVQNSYASTGATSILFGASTTRTLTNFTASGAAGNILSLGSITAGTRATLSKSSGTVSVSYCTITDIAATGGATWNAYITNGNTDGGNNTGWIFAAAAGGNFLMMFR